MKKLFKFYLDCGRMGGVSGLFISTQDEVDKAIGKEVFFGDILGKYSEINGALEESEITLIEVSDNTIKELEEKIGTTISGYNPLEYIEE